MGMISKTSKKSAETTATSGGAAVADPAPPGLSEHAAATVSDGGESCTIPAAPIVEKSAAPANPLDRLLVDKRQCDAEDASVRAANDKEAFTQYVSILRRAVDRNPDPADGQDLAAIMADQRISETQLKADLALIERVLMKREDASNSRPADARELEQLRQKIRDAELSLRKAESDLSKARSRGSFRRDALADLREIARIRPALFEPIIAGQSIRLLGEPETAAAGE